MRLERRARSARRLEDARKRQATQDRDIRSTRAHEPRTVERPDHLVPDHAARISDCAVHGRLSSETASSVREQGGDRGRRSDEVGRRHGLGNMEGETGSERQHPILRSRERR